MSIHAPYNFVPLSDKTVTDASWKDSISQDVPFEDALSGTIDVKLTARTPIFIRQGSADKNKKEKSFCKRPDGKYFIPATSIKGELRNILEIISFSKMSQVGADRYSIRDLRNRKDYRDKMQDIQCGLMWWDKDNDEVVFEIHGKPEKISHQEIGKILKIPFDNEFHDVSGNKKLASYKYSFVRKRISVDYKDVDNHITINNNDYILVFTGQPGRNNSTNRQGRPTGKHHEYLIPDDPEQDYDQLTYKYDSQFNEDTDQLIKDFLFIYRDSQDWISLWKPIFEEGQPVPVFMAIRNNEIIHFGLTYLYRLPFAKNLNEYVPQSHKTNDFDLGEAIFGKVGTNSKDSIKGRVQVSHAEAISFSVLSEMSVYQASPKPSYYPAYMEQKANQNGQLIGDHYETMSNPNATLRGRKLYPARTNISKNFPNPDGQDENKNPFTPLSSGSTFSFRINYHNLKPFELGSLLRSIQLWDNCYHSIGALKPYGYGSCKMEIESIKAINEDGDTEDLKSKSESFMKIFDLFMEDRINGYQTSTQITELKAMLNPKYSEGKILEYQLLRNANNQNEFVTSINNKEVLLPYTKQR